MINVTREAKSPASLQTKEIKDFLSACAAWLPVHGATPPKPPPYRTSDLLQAFDRCFFGKCYLTEELFPNSWALDVEHFVSKKGKPDLIHDWNNLLPAAPVANQMKPRSQPKGGYLNPANPKDDVESRIVYSLVDHGSKPGFAPFAPSDVPAMNTSGLLNRLHNGHDTDTTMRTAALRQSISKRYHEILLTIIKWQGARLVQDRQGEIQAEHELKGFLSRKASFTMLMRSTPPVIAHVPTSFFD